jgi:hypothetical protein
MLSHEGRKEELKSQIELMEKEYVFLKGSERAQVRMKYLMLVKSYGKQCGLDEPLYIMRC